MEVMNENSSLLNLIKQRRTIYPPAYTEKELDRKDIEMMLEAATWAPNHGNTEPWRFFVFQRNARKKLAEFLAAEYKAQFQGDLFSSRKFSNVSTWPLLAQTVIAVAMKRHLTSKIPLIEEERAVACAIQNMLLMAQDLGIASYWSSGKLVYSPAMKSFLNLEAEDQVIGLIYLAYSKDQVPTKTRTPFTHFTKWYE
jgi:nitroreductase